MDLKGAYDLDCKHVFDPGIGNGWPELWINILLQGFVYHENRQKHFPYDGNHYETCLV